MKARRKAFDWQRIKQRLAGVQSQTDGAGQLERARRDQAFHERALRLAARGRIESQETRGVPVMTFRLGQERMAIELRSVAQVFQRPSVTPVPGAADHLRGVAHLQGNLRSVIDLARLLNITADADAGGHVLLVRAANTTFGLWTDAVESIAFIDLARLAETDDATPAGERRLVRGTTADRISLLDLDALAERLGQSRADQSASSHHSESQII